MLLNLLKTCVINQKKNEQQLWKLILRFIEYIWQIFAGPWLVNCEALLLFTLFLELGFKLYVGPNFMTLRWAIGSYDRHCSLFHRLGFISSDLVWLHFLCFCQLVTLCMRCSGTMQLSWHLSLMLKVCLKQRCYDVLWKFYVSLNCCQICLSAQRSVHHFSIKCCTTITSRLKGGVDFRDLQEFQQDYSIEKQSRGPEFIATHQ